MNKRQPVRHGEIFLKPVDKLPEGNRTMYDSFVVGHSETGHHHYLKSTDKFEVVMDKLSVYLYLAKEATLVHDKTVNRHNDIVVQPGMYEVIRKKEYNPFTKAMEQVWD